MRRANRPSASPCCSACSIAALSSYCNRRPAIDVHSTCSKCCKNVAVGELCLRRLRGVVAHDGAGCGAVLRAFRQGGFRVRPDERAFAGAALVARRGEGSPLAVTSPSARCVPSGVAAGSWHLRRRNVSLAVGTTPAGLFAVYSPGGGSLIVDPPPHTHTHTHTRAQVVRCHTVCSVFTLQILTGGSGSWLCLSLLLPPVVQTFEDYNALASM